jgi:hypothetical protein
MLPLLNIFLLTTAPVKNIVPIRTYISKYVEGKYIIDSDLRMDLEFCFNYKADSYIDFLAYLIKLDVEYVVSGEYIIFRKKNNDK